MSTSKSITDRIEVRQTSCTRNVAVFGPDLVNPSRAILCVPLGSEGGKYIEWRKCVQGCISRTLAFLMDHFPWVRKTDHYQLHLLTLDCCKSPAGPTKEIAWTLTSISALSPFTWSYSPSSRHEAIASCWMRTGIQFPADWQRPGMHVFGSFFSQDETAISLGFIVGQLLWKQIAGSISVYVQPSAFMERIACSIELLSRWRWYAKFSKLQSSFYSGLLQGAALEKCLGLQSSQIFTPHKVQLRMDLSSELVVWRYWDVLGTWGWWDHLGLHHPLKWWIWGWLNHVKPLGFTTWLFYQLCDLVVVMGMRCNTWISQKSFFFWSKSLQSNGFLGGVEKCVHIPSWWDGRRSHWCYGETWWNQDSSCGVQPLEAHLLQMNRGFNVGTSSINGGFSSRDQRLDRVKEFLSVLTDLATANWAVSLFQLVEGKLSKETPISDSRKNHGVP